MLTSIFTSVSKIPALLVLLLLLLTGLPISDLLIDSVVEKIVNR